jgi:hypothetical protein
MPVVSVYPAGLTMHVPHGVSEHKRGKRGEVTGWSVEAVRRHTQWLRSIDVSALDGVGYAVTLTIRDLPPDAAAFHAARRAFLMRVTRKGAIRTHWIVEWQRRRIPHLHLALYFPNALSRTEQALMLEDWCAVAGAYAPLSGSQDCKEISGASGWLQYLSKHSARGVDHYQRYGKPASWEKTGRLWGHSDGWPEADPMRFHLDSPGWFRFRRLARSWRVANARQERSKSRNRRISSARRALNCSEPKLSSVRGVSEWLPEELAVQFLALLSTDGHQVHQTE